MPSEDLGPWWLKHCIVKGVFGKQEKMNNYE